MTAIITVLAQTRITTYGAGGGGGGNGGNGFNGTAGIGGQIIVYWVA